MMNSLPEALPDVEYLLSMSAEELAAVILQILRRQRQGGLVHLANLQDSLFSGQRAQSYPKDRRSEIELAIAEAWSWLEVNGLLLTAPGGNGANGFRVFSRRAEKMKDQEDVQRFARARKIQKDSLHPRIAESVWSAFMRSEFDVAVFQAMKAVEVAVREVGGYSDQDIGVALMRKAFHEDTGALTDAAAEKSERQARSNLFAGAIGSYKNALSHRDVNIDDADEAMELVMLANHLLRIVDRRRATA